MTVAGGGLRRCLDALYDFAGALAAAALFAILVLMLLGSLGRALDWRVSWVADVVSWLCAASALLAMAHTFKHGDFVRVTLLLQRTAPRVRWLLEAGCLTVATVALSYLAFWAVRFTFESWQFNDIANNMVPIALWIPQLSFVLGAVLFAVAALDELFIVVRGGTPTYEQRLAERMARGDFSEEI
jgi:TRAP-type C4-dicarboxylate transport system permease small subunit